MNRALTIKQKFKVYANTAPAMIPEVFTIIGFVIPLLAQGEPGAYFAIIFFLIGGYFLGKKIRTVRTATRVLQSGTTTNARIVDIRDTNTKHNKRTVKAYTFEFSEGEDIYTYEYRSAHKPELQMGDELEIYYLRKNPDDAFIPSLYSLDI